MDLYRRYMKHKLENTPGLAIRQDSVEGLLVDKTADGLDKVVGVETRFFGKFKASAVVITAGTFLNGLIHIGDERISAGDGALFLEYGIAMRSGVALAYLSSHAIEEGVYRFGGEGHLVQLRLATIPAALLNHLAEPLAGPFALITPGIWGSPKLSLREPIISEGGRGVHPWHRDGQAPGILTDKPRPWRHRLGVGDGKPDTQGRDKKRRLSRGRWAVPAGSCYQLSGDPLEPWVEWHESWFPREGFSFKQLGTALALPLHGPP
jgi:CRISPR-associated protein Cmr3